MTRISRGVSAIILGISLAAGPGALPAFADDTTPTQQSTQPSNTDKNQDHQGRHQWCKDSPEKCKEKREEWCKTNPQKCQEHKERHEQWCKDHPDKCTQHGGDSDSKSSPNSNPAAPSTSTPDSSPSK